MTPKAEPRTVRAHCPSCGADRDPAVLGEHEETWHNEQDGVAGANRYRILKCAGCDEVFFQKQMESEYEMVPDPDPNPDPDYPQGFVPRVRSQYWPSAVVRPKPAWVDDLISTDWTLYQLLQETYQALNDGLQITTALGMRTAFDRASELLGIDPALPFAKKLDELQKQGLIGAHEKDALSVLVDAGSAAAHRAWRPSVEQLRTMIAIIEPFLHRSFIGTEAAKRLKEKVPPKPRRKP
jgi:hypothetical protein